MIRRRMDAFCWRDEAILENSAGETEKYQEIVSWALKARGSNPLAFDKLAQWLLDDSQWSRGRLHENRQVLMQEILSRFVRQNARLRADLLTLQAAGLVHEPVWKALDQFDEALSGVSHEPDFKDAVALMFRDFSAMERREIREKIAGTPSGPAGVDTIHFYGYINLLKDCDAQVQWALFMPDMVKRQQNGFMVESFEYIKAPAMRFIGRETGGSGNADLGREVFATLDSLNGYASDIKADILFMHHFGLCVDAEPCHSLWGRFMQAGTPVPEGFECFDLIPCLSEQTGAPYMSQYAYATFSGDVEAMHRSEGYDRDAMYDVTRNIILGQCVIIPYPHHYWTAQVFLDGFENPGTGYMFSVAMDPLL